jgi:hypothetical protein
VQGFRVIGFTVRYFGYISPQTWNLEAIRAPLESP